MIISIFYIHYLFKSHNPYQKPAYEKCIFCNKLKNIREPVDSTDVVPNRYVLLRVSETGDTLNLGNDQ